ncbi:MAG: hypothetical protein E7483_02905 [Ruminococcaceae bacterium]|nr:hypothetical protein [Oscillospiraceae bacterium]
MLENTISINGEETLETEGKLQENAAQEKESLQKTDDTAALQQLSEEKGQAESEEETPLEDEEMLTLTVYGDTLTVPKSQAISAAQKGFAFESMKQKYAFVKNDARLQALDSLAQISGKNISQLLGDMTRQALTDKLTEKYGNIDAVPLEEFEEAMQTVYTTRKSIENAADKMTIMQKQSQLEEFLQYNPGCTEIPPQVVERARQGENLSLAYSQYQTALLTQQLEQAQKELKVFKSIKEAKEKSMPSAQSTAANSNTDSVYNMMKSLW